jgi:hypothetical protein
MPEISRFYGIVIRMNINDHPPPHFHAYYGEQEALVDIRTGAIHRGGLPPRAWRLVSEWFALHQAELQENWNRAMSELPLLSIAPL